MRHLCWLSFIGVLGSLAWITGIEGYYALFGFFAFLSLFWYDERTEALFKQATSITFIVTTIMLAGTFVYMGLVARYAPDAVLADRVIIALAMGLGVTYIAHLLTFTLSFIYFSLRGFKH